MRWNTTGLTATIAGIVLFSIAASGDAFPMESGVHSAFTVGQSVRQTAATGKNGLTGLLDTAGNTREIGYQLNLTLGGGSRSHFRPGHRYRPHQFRGRGHGHHRRGFEVWKQDPYRYRYSGPYFRNRHRIGLKHRSFGWRPYNDRLYRHGR